MARQGRRLTIGGSGVALSDDDSFAQTGSRGDVRRFTPQSEADIAKEAQRLADASKPVETPPVIIMDQPQAPESGGDAPGTGTGTGTGTGPSGGDPGGPGDAGVEAKGGKIKGSSQEHPITAQAGEWVIQKSAVAKYGDSFLAALNAGKVEIQHRPAKQGARYRRLA